MSAAPAMGETASAKTARLRIWDGPTRVMHWLLVAFIAVCWWTGVDDQLQVHLYAGYAILWIVVLRLYWGFAGSSTARFAHFVRGPRHMLDYARTLHRRDTTHSYGHNPLGAISVLVMLGVVLAVVGLGLFAVDVDGLYSGPLSVFVSFRLGRHLAHLHYRWFEYLLAVIALHLAAVVFYYVYKRQNLVFPMISGSRTVAQPVEEELKTVPVWRLVLGAAIASAVVWIAVDGIYYFT